MINSLKRIHFSFLLILFTILVLTEIFYFVSFSFGQENKPNKVVFAITGEPGPLDAHAMGGPACTSIFYVLYDRLVGYDENMNIVPELAEKWELTDDLTWTFTLRTGLKFHDGNPVNAEAVKQSFERILDEKNAFPYRNNFVMIDKINVINENTVSFVTKKPYLFLPQALTLPAAGIVSPSAANRMGKNQFASNPVGSGPYIFKEWVRGSHVLVEKNPNHWLKDESNIDMIEFRVMVENTSRVIGLETGEIDMAYSVYPRDAERLKENSNLNVYNFPVLRTQGIMMNCAKKPFNDPRVREAVSLAIDKAAIVDNFLLGYGKVADSPLAEGNWGYLAQPLIEYNPEKAKKLLAEAGYPNGFKTKLVIPTGWFILSEEISEACAFMLNEVGIETDVEFIENAIFLEQISSKGPEDSKLEMGYYGYGNWTGAPDYALRVFLHTDNFSPKGINRGFYSNSEVDNLLDNATQTVDDEERRGMYEKIQSLIWNDYPYAYIFFQNTPVVAQKKLSGFTLLPTETFILRELRIEE